MNKFIILVPVAQSIDPACEQSLQALEKRGYTVRRVRGFSAIDFGRCVMASDALAEGFEELMWIDSDIGFHPDDVDRLRARQLPIVCGIYLKKSRPEFACDIMPGTKEIVLGREGGLYEIRSTGLGFVHTRREVYETMRHKLDLAECNQRFGKKIVPYFLPMVVPDGAGRWYLAEDYAFCARVRQCGYKIMADSTIFLSHIGSYGYSWDDMANKREKHANVTVKMDWNPTKALASDSREQHFDIQGKA